MAPFVPILLVLSAQALELHRPGPEHEGLVEALRIRLRDRLVDPPDDGSELGRQPSLAAAVAWVETSTAGPDTFVIVQARGGARSMERIAIEGRPGFDRDRATALKIEEALDGRRISPIRASDVRFLRGEDRDRGGFSFSFEAGGLGAVGDHDGGLRGGIFATLGPGLLTRDWRLELRTGAELIGDHEVSTDAGTAILGEWAWVVALRALANLGSVEWGPALSAKVRFVDAEADGAPGAPVTDDALLPAITLGSDLRIPFSKWFFLRVFVGAGLNLERRRLELEGMDPVDLGVWSAETQISLLISTF